MKLREMQRNPGILPFLSAKLIPKGGSSLRNKKEDKIAALQLPPVGLMNVPYGGIIGDPLGSYTGRPVNEFGIPEEDMLPVQDADDL